MEQNNYSVLKIYASTTDKIGVHLFYEHMVYLAKENGIAGVTVYRGIMGYGLSSKQVSSSRYWELTEKLPVVIEMVDKTENLEKFYHLIEPEILNMPKGCLVALEPLSVKLLKPGKR
jgi:PII-like signaling protein